MFGLSKIDSTFVKNDSSASYSLGTKLEHYHHVYENEGCSSRAATRGSDYSSLCLSAIENK